MEKERRTKEDKGITLIALIVTTIVLLILSGISIAMLIGNNGILNSTAEANTETKRAELIERVKLDILETQLNNMGNITNSDLRTILNNYFLEVPETLPENAEELKNLELTSKEGKYKIKVGEIKGTLSRVSGGKELPETAEGQPAGTAIKNPKSYGTNPNAQATADGTGKYFALPKGAEYLDGTVDTGVVINIDDSEFVWVPVPEAVFDNSKAGNLPTSNTAGIKQGNTYTPMAIETSIGNYSGILYDYSEDNAYLSYPAADKYQGTGYGSYREPDVLNNDQQLIKETLQTAYNEMVVRVVKYGGFYVGRYEMGIEGDKIVSKNASKNASVLTADASQAKTKTWYGLYQAGMEFETTAKVKSSMMWGSQYDAMMNWMAKGGVAVGIKNWDKNNGEEITGKSETDEINKIYDLYGCHTEWTLELFEEADEPDATMYRSYRGGYQRSEGPAYRNINWVDYEDETSARMTLYIK